jgi:membrane protease YdiL (CAAX protease family)
VNPVVAEATLDRWGPPAVLLVWWLGAALSHTAGMWVGVGATAIALAAALLLADGARLRALAAPRRGAVVYGLLVGAFMTLATYPLYPLVADLAPSLAGDVAELYGKLGASGTGWRALWLVPIILAEELVWRGFVQSALQRRFGARSALLLAAALYAVAHAPVGSVLLVVVAFACGLVWSALRAATAGLVAPLLAHLVWDAVVLLIAPLRVP